MSQSTNPLRNWPLWLAATMFAVCAVYNLAHAEQVTIRIGWQRPLGWLPRYEYPVYVCRGTCDQNGRWLVERDATGEPVVFGHTSSCPSGVDDPCYGYYPANWLLEETWSFALTTRDPESGEESVRSNIVTLTYSPPTPTTTTITLQTPRAPELGSVSILPP